MNFAIQNLNAKNPLVWSFEVAGMIEERACRKTDFGGGDYYLRNSGLPPSSCKACEHLYFIDPEKYLSIDHRSPHRFLDSGNCFYMARAPH